jgi:hypothetical protein
MKRLLLLLAVAVLTLPALASAQTPTPVTVASPSPDGSQSRNALAPNRGGFAFEQPDIFEGGLQIGKTSDSASLLTFVARGTCYVDPSASLGDAAETIVSCVATGAAVGDMGLASIESTEDVTDVYIKRIRVNANSIQFTFGSYTAAQNPGTLTVNFLVIR